MLRYLILLVSIIFLGPHLSGQVSPFQSAEIFFCDSNCELNYLAPIKHLLKNKGRFEKSAYDQALSTYLSFISKNEIPYVRNQTKNARIIKSNQTCKVTEFFNVFMLYAKKERIVLINEAHDKPMHRAFVMRILDSLFYLGFRYLSLEALSEGDTSLMERKYPIGKSGFYVREPTMANLIRYAIKIGYKVVGHEIKTDQEMDFEDWVLRSNYRDSMQSVNLAALIQRDSNAKIIALVGYDHILEKERDGLRRLASYLQERTLINPLTIDQTLGCTNLSSNLKGPAILISADFFPITAGFNEGFVDMQVIHPVISYKHKRAEWLFNNGINKEILITLPVQWQKKKCFIQIYDRNEYNKFAKSAIPLDQFLIGRGEKHVYGVIYKNCISTVVKFLDVNF
jgi:hypothetical protein